MIALAWLQASSRTISTGDQMLTENLAQALG